MLPERLRTALREYKSGELSEQDLEELLRHLPFEDLGYARVDHHRSLRHGFPEVIFGEGKSVDQTLGIARSLLEHNPNLLITRSAEDVAIELASEVEGCRYHPECRAVTVRREDPPVGRGIVGVFAAGTSDLPVAEEASVTARMLGSRVETAYDVGVAGIHRIVGELDTLQRCTVAIVVAGMEGALPSVVGGLVDLPIIAVPTSVGYGASFGGLAALLGMLNSCASGVTVVNIDNGFGAGYVASLINRRRPGD